MASATVSSGGVATQAYDVGSSFAVYSSFALGAVVLSNSAGMQGIGPGPTRRIFGPFSTPVTATISSYFGDISYDLPVSSGGGAGLSVALQSGNGAVGSVYVATATGGYVPTGYQWRLGGSNIGGATSSTYTSVAPGGLDCLGTGTVAGNSITVAPVGILTGPVTVAPTGTTYDLTTATGPAYADYYIPVQRSGSAAGSAWTRKAGANLIVANANTGNVLFSTLFGAIGQTVAVDAGDSFDNNSASLAFTVTNPGGFQSLSSSAQAGISFTYPGSTSFTRKVRIWCASYTSTTVLYCTLSDGSAVPLVIPLTNNANTFVEISFRPLTPGATMTLALQKATPTDTTALSFCVLVTTLQTA